MLSPLCFRLALTVLYSTAKEAQYQPSSMHYHRALLSAYLCFCARYCGDRPRRSIMIFSISAASALVPLNCRSFFPPIFFFSHVLSLTTTVQIFIIIIEYILLNEHAPHNRAAVLLCVPALSSGRSAAMQGGRGIPTRARRKRFVL